MIVVDASVWLDFARGRGRAARAAERLSVAEGPLFSPAHVDLEVAQTLRRFHAGRLIASAYDAAYLALAELLAVPLLTADARLAHVPGHRARIELLS